MISLAATIGTLTCAACIVTAMGGGAKAQSAASSHARSHFEAHALGLPPVEPGLSEPDNTSGFMQPLTGTLNGWYDQYEAVKKNLQTDTGIEFAMPVSVYGQWGTPNGGSGTVEIVYAPYITWAAFADTAIGSGTFTFAFQSNQFWTRANMLAQQQSMGLLVAPNGWGTNGHQFAQITYTHTLPGNWLAVSIGQYSFGLYDGNAYAGSGQTGFVNYALSWNGTQTYPNAGTGAFVQVRPAAALQFAAGLQGAADVTGAALTTSGLCTGRIAYFASVQWMPELMAGGSYGILYYSQPSVLQQPAASQGISFSAVQKITARYGVFLRANNASGSANPIRTSLAFGAVVDNPLGRNDLDQVGLGFAWNKINRAYVDTAARRDEQVGELYYSFAVFKGLQVTPDLQVYVKPVLAPRTSIAAVFTLRTTLNF